MKDKRFYNRNLKPKKEGAGRQGERSMITLSRAADVLHEASMAWSAMDTFRKKTARSTMYAFGDQWGDRVPVFNKSSQCDEWMSESAYIRKEGKVPLKNNMIRPILKNIEGQFRQNQTKPLAVVRDPSKQELGEMCTIALEYADYINELKQLDAAALTTLELSGLCMQRMEYNFNAAKQQVDVWVYNCNPYRIFFNTNTEDVRGWDINLIGELIDMPFKDVVTAFAKTSGDEQNLNNIYGGQKENTDGTLGALQGDDNKNMDFSSPSRHDLSRVILVWKKESRPAYFCHDYLNGEWWYAAPSEKAEVDAENARRLAEALAAGVEEEDVLLIECEWEIEQYWYYRYMSPAGHVLKEGRSPYWHKMHNYEIGFFPFVHGKLQNFTEDFIDQQRSINRTLTQIDFIRGAAAKGMVVYDESAFAGYSPEDLATEYTRSNGMIAAKLKPGQNIENVLKQFNGSANTANDFQLLSVQLQLINDIAGVNSAMQGKAPASGTPASLYAQETHNASLNIMGLLESFTQFRLKRYNKMMKVIQQYYKSGKFLDVAGSNYKDESKYWSADKVRDLDIDVSITEGNTSPSYQMVMNDFLMQLFQQQAIDVRTLLENSSFPFSKRILEALDNNQRAMEQAQAAGAPAQLPGIPPEVMQEMAQQQGRR